MKKLLFSITTCVLALSIFAIEAKRHETPDKMNKKRITKKEKVKPAKRTRKYDKKRVTKAKRVKRAPITERVVIAERVGTMPVAAPCCQKPRCPKTRCPKKRCDKKCGRRRPKRCGKICCPKNPCCPERCNRCCLKTPCKKACSTTCVTTCCEKCEGVTLMQKATVEKVKFATKEYMDEEYTVEKKLIPVTETVTKYVETEVPVVKMVKKTKLVPVLEPVEKTVCFSSQKLGQPCCETRKVTRCVKPLPRCP